MEIERLSLLLALNHPKEQVEVTPPASKSESNRVLVIDALAEIKAPNIENISSARDTQTMLRLLNNFHEADILDVLDAGTTMRFLLAFSSIQKTAKVLTGTKRLQERPIAPLTQALSEIGAAIEYLGKRGYPPVRIEPFSNQKADDVSIASNISSQFISALLMIAPTLPKGLRMTLVGDKISSLPYIKMTLEIMEKYQINYTWHQNLISIPASPYQWSMSTASYVVESDWSSASYWYSLVAISIDLQVKLLGYRYPSIQGDCAILDIMDHLGVSTEYIEDENALILRKKTHVASEFVYDFSNCPDLAQTVIVICAVKGIKSTFFGLDSLFIKETDRVAALQNELKKFGVRLYETHSGKYALEGVFKFPKDELIIETYDDHRMAMSFAPLAMLDRLTILNPSVVNKSYPEFWDHMKKIS